MSLIYELNIPFNKSADYQRLLLLTYGLGLASVWYFSYPIWISIYVSLGIIVHGVHLFRIAKPYANHQALVYHNRRWILYAEMGHETEYEEMRIQYDFRFVLCLALIKNHRKRFLIFFHDQLTDEMRRSLYLLQQSDFKAKKSYMKIDQEPAE